jgi:hypothetical protein
MKIYAAEQIDGDRTIGGFVCEWESGVRKVVAWRQSAPIAPTKDAAQEFVSKLVQALLDARHTDEVETTNWASAVAAVQKIITDWNERQTSARYAADLAALEARAASSGPGLEGHGPGAQARH